MNKKISFGSLLQVTIFVPLFSTATEYSNAESSAANPLLEQLINQKLGVVFSSIILHLFNLLVQLDGLTYRKNLSGLTLAGGAA